MQKITDWNRRNVMQAAGALWLATAGGGAMAQSDYPMRPIKVVVPYSAGGNTDTITRSVMRELATRIGQPVVIENKPGANSILGTDLVAKAAPDGYTLLVTIGAYANNQSLYKSLPYAPTDLVPVSHLTRTSLVLVCSDPQIRTVADLVRKANQPGATVTFASSGVGSAAHLLGERLVRGAGLRSAQHVPYKGTNDAMGDLLGGRVSFMFDAVSAMGPHIRQGKLNALAVTGARRSPLLPDVPSILELGYPNLVANAWAVVLAPAGTPAAVIQKLSTELAAVLRNPQLQSKLEAISTETVGGSPAELAAFIDHEVKVNREVIRQLQITLD